jgi:DNA-binding helix-hairpin-helix protein with protein kinase domain
MPYREKLAWLSLAAMAITFGPYFAVIAAGGLPGNAVPDLRKLGVYAAVALTQAAILGIGHVVLRRLSPQDARLPLDERDQQIRHRAANWAYGVLLTGMIFVGVVMPFTAQGWAIVNAALFMIVAAEAVRYAIVAASYRRQA